MVDLKKISVFVFLAALFLMLLVGNASARVSIFNGTITEGDGYQINNYVIDVSSVFVEANTAVFKVYEGGELKKDTMIERNDSIAFDFEEGEMELRLLSVYGGVLPVAKVFITVSDYNIGNIYTSGIVDGGHEHATYSGTPVLEITKTVDKNNILVGDSIKVTIAAVNTGNDEAKDVIFTNPMQESFILEDIFVEPASTTSIDIGELKTIYVYILKATEAGTFTLKPTTATFSNNADQNFPPATSNTPKVTVEVLEIPKKTAVIEISTDVDSVSVARNDQITATVHLKNAGDAPASFVWIEIAVPEEFEYISGDDAIEIIGGVPKIYMDSFGPLQEKEFSYTLKAKTLGTYTLISKLSYEYNNDVDFENQKVSTESVTNDIYVQKGKYDDLYEQPVYIFVLPIVAIAVIGAWIYHRYKQYRF
ncbi:MAG: DUF11 domain-containing protein [Methanosarcinaceae archaeon]|nr:DUF11 domain-containing protein [Methanosarcinaceae archaeon]